MPITLLERSRIELATTVRIAASINSVEFTGNPLAATIDPGSYDLVITGLSPSTFGS